jgi:DNA polymerase-3 subunit gamma/tau
MAWIVCVTAQVRELDDEVLTLVFPSEKDAASFRPQPGVPGGVHEILRDAINAQLGITVKFRVSVEGTPTASIPTATDSVPTATAAPAEPKSSSKREFATPAPAEVTDEDGWSVVAIPGSVDEVPPADAPLDDEPAPEEASIEDAAHAPQFGEAVVRQILGGTLIGEENTGEIEVFETEEDQPLAMLDESDR